MAEVVRLDFGDGKVRKLKPKHRHIASAVQESGKSISELMSDPFNGYRYLLRAMLREQDPTMTLDKVSDLIDTYSEKNDGITGLSEALMKAMALYLHIELTPAEDEEVDGERPNAATPDAPGPSAA